MQSSQYIVTGVALGIALSLCFALLIFLVWRNPGKLIKILVSFLKVEVIPFLLSRHSSRMLIVAAILHRY